ncbi:hypothetical protein SLS53_001272 [Cytospora paraplurivora]|uniref:Uncharacterized protein n=1 Tax=Cytospora paraplurivora TaxID=2898453 RepID=A0AAN9UHC2_9PEZI
MLLPKSPSFKTASTKSSAEDLEDHQGDKEDDKSGSILPGCSKEKHHNEKWNVSTTMMQAYLAMKGPGADMEDPLVKWIEKQEVEQRQEGGSTLLGDAMNSIKEQGEWNVRGPAAYDEDDKERKVNFSYKRPKMHHFIIDAGRFDPDEMEEMCQSLDKLGGGWARYAASEVSDDGEGDPADGRISPCTFAHWARGAKRWDAPGDKYKSIWEKREGYDIPDVRQRPASPNTALPRRTKERNKERLYDEEDGRTLSSPACSGYANTEPSILWSSPPMDPALPYNFFNHLFDRMDPALMREVRRNNTSPQPSWGVSTPTQPEHYTTSEVEAAVDKYWGATRTADIIAAHRRDLCLLRLEEAEASAANERYRHECRALGHENRRLADCLAARRERRERRIMREVQASIGALRYECGAKAAELRARLREHGGLRRELRGLLGVRRGLLAELGKETAEEVFEMFPEVWEGEGERKNRRNFS